MQPPPPPHLSLISLSILSVTLLHSLWCHDPSYLAGKGEELRIKNRPKTTTGSDKEPTMYVQAWLEVKLGYSTIAIKHAYNPRKKISSKYPQLQMLWQKSCLFFDGAQMCTHTDLIHNEQKTHFRQYRAWKFSSLSVFFSWYVVGVLPQWQCPPPHCPLQDFARSTHLEPRFLSEIILVGSASSYLLIKC